MTRARLATALAALLLACLQAGATAQERSDQDQEWQRPPFLPPEDKLEPFPYELINYTQAAHEFRWKNAPVIVLGRVESYKQIEGTQKVLNWSIWLQVDEWLRTDRPHQENADSVHFRLLPLKEPYAPIAVGDRCLVVLDRDARIDNALILPTDMHYYPVTEAGMVQKFHKDAPTKDAPVLREVPLASFKEQIRGLLHRISIEQQARTADLVMTGLVTHSAQGAERARDYFFVEVQPEKVFKGEVGKGVVHFMQKSNVYRWTIEALDRAAFREGERILCLANKDPTYSQEGSWNPEGVDMYVFPFQRHSSLFIASTTSWRQGFRPIPLEQLYADLERWCAPSDEADAAPAGGR
ncbi:MAG: hypothetical protein JW819_00865 [Candidatus Krumholzibacteriota bacterium]|nr:hypothetical protein [Candidatus Krumholzibacteriota bacterium]